jgi:tetratricopeptide (TPR) repeat protein
MAKKPDSSSDQTAAITDPVTPEDFFARGWTHYSKKEFFRAESDFRKALELAPNHIDALFALGQSLQASGRPADAVAEYDKLLALLANPSDANHVRYLMLARLTKGHINLIKTGDWKINE